MKIKKVLVCLMAIIILSVSICSIYMVKSANVKNDNSHIFSKITAVNNRQGNDNYNIINGGRIDEEDGWIYYSLNDGLYKCKEDGSNKIKLYDNQYIYSINVIGDWIYFHSLGIHRIKTDGTNYELISTLDYRGGDNIINDKLYSSNKCRMDLDGNNLEQLHDNQSALGYTLNIVDDWIYFLDKDSINGESKIFRMKLNGTELQSIINERVDYMCIEGDWIYYIKYGVNKLYKISTDGSKNQLVLDDYANGNIIVKNEWIYYQSHDYLKKMKTDGQQVEVLTTIKKICSLQLHGNWLYYNYDENEDEWNRVKIDGTENECFAKYGEVVSTKILDNTYKKELAYSQDGLEIYVSHKMADVPIINITGTNNTDNDYYCYITDVLYKNKYSTMSPSYDISKDEPNFSISTESSFRSDESINQKGYCFTVVVNNKKTNEEVFRKNFEEK